MAFTEIIDTFKAKFHPTKIMNSLETVAHLYEESDSDSKGNNSGEDQKNNPYSNLFDDSVINPKAMEISQNGDPFIKLTDAGKSTRWERLSLQPSKG
jgi:putative ABC transport system ATP-binding protein